MKKVVLALLVAAGFGVTLARSQAAHPTLTSVAYRVHHEAAMVAFYREAFGVQFRTVETNGIRSQFGQLAGLTLKLVPIRESADFVGFPTQQLGFDVADVGDVIKVALRHGGRIQDSPRNDGTRVVASVRDPDGNTIELSGPRVP